MQSFRKVFEKVSEKTVSALKHFKVRNVFISSCYAIIFVIQSTSFASQELRIESCSEKGVVNCFLGTKLTSSYYVLLYFEIVFKPKHFPLFSQPA